MKLRTVKSCWQQDISKKEYAVGAGKTTVVIGIMAWLYYRSPLALIPLFPVWLWYYRMWESGCAQKKMRQFRLQFKDAIQSLASSLSAGYSVENAWKETEREMEVLYRKEERIIKELQHLTMQLRVNVPMEQALEELAGRVRLEDVENFAAVFTSAKKTGGDMIAIIQDAVRQIGDKIEVKREIDTILAAKEYEFKVMTVVPYIIIGYMSVSFPEFMDALYGNALGIGVMTGCLGVYIGAYYLGVRMIRIEV